MYCAVLGKISAIPEDALPAPLRLLAPQGGRRAPWIAGRTLLLRALNLPTLPDIVPGANGKPAFHDDIALWFNISHSGDDIAVLVSDQGDVGCDLERIRPRQNWRRIAAAMFSADEQTALVAATDVEQTALFWQIWTRKEAQLKYAGQSVWAMAALNNHEQDPPFTSQFLIDDALILALSTPTPYAFSAADFSHFRGGFMMKIESVPAL